MPTTASTHAVRGGCRILITAPRNGMKIGGLALGELPAGEWRLLDGADREKLFA